MVGNPWWVELNKYVCISQTKGFCDFPVMFIQQTSPVSFLHYQWLRCIQSVELIFNLSSVCRDSRFLWQRKGDFGHIFMSTFYSFLCVPAYFDIDGCCWFMVLDFQPFFLFLVHEITVFQVCVRNENPQIDPVVMDLNSRNWIIGCLTGWK